MELKDNKIFNCAITIVVITSTSMNKERVWTHTLEVFRLMHMSVANAD